MGVKCVQKGLNTGVPNTINREKYKIDHNLNLKSPMFLIYYSIQCWTPSGGFPFSFWLTFYQKSISTHSLGPAYPVHERPWIDPWHHPCICHMPHAGVVLGMSEDGSKIDSLLGKVAFLVQCKLIGFSVHACSSLAGESLMYRDWTSPWPYATNCW